MILPLLLLLAADPKEALTFRATFDKGPDADFAKGDKSIYFAPSYKEQSAAVKGFGQAPVAIENGALRFKSKHTTALFFNADSNVPQSTGTISFKLKLDSALDLAPDYVDPIQFTDKAYNDSAIWVDFTKDEKPRLFRLGVFGDLKVWNPANVGPDKNNKFNERLVVVKQPPFTREKWTHIVITYSELGAGKGTASLYVDGKLQGNSSPIAESFSWAPGKATIRLGVNYTGLMDDISIYNRVLTPSEISKLK
jgi:hypothetical protein